MKKHMLFIAIAFLMGAMALLYSSCEQEQARPMVMINGDFINTPELDCGAWMFALPPDEIAQIPEVYTFKYKSEGKNAGSHEPCAVIPKEYAMSGTCTFFGKIDYHRSVIRYSGVEFDPDLGFRGYINITLSDFQGNQLYLAGEFTHFNDLTSKSFLRFEGGTGMFVNSEGWMTAIGKIDAMTGVHSFTGFGEVTEPLSIDPVDKLYKGAVEHKPAWK